MLEDENPDVLLQAIADVAKAPGMTQLASDPAHWASKHSERVESFASWGSKVVDGFSNDGSNNVSVSVDVHDLEAMKAAMATPEMDAAKQAHGVLEPLSVFVERK